MTKFDLNQELIDLACPDMFKAGLKEYISINNIKITNKREFEKTVKVFANIKIGG